MKKSRKAVCHDQLKCVSHKLNKKKTYQSSDRRGQPVNPLDDTRLDLVDQTVSKRKKEREREYIRGYK